ncbi:MAG: hypothetical protein IT334_13320 [Thermomicrobiales bacterium]|nr:hypothetical protein [Thermomicrobiales bacterium]
MRTARSVWRSLFAAALVLALFGGLAPAPSSAQGEMATLTIHSRFCPPNYGGSDLFGDCHDNPGIQGIQFGISSATGRRGSGTPDTEGNLTFHNLPAGDYRITSTVPTNKQHNPAVYCSPGDGSTATHFPSTNDYQSESTISIAAGQSLVCDWYTIPTADFNTTHSNLTIHNRFCPIGYNGGNFFEDCHDNVGIAYVSFGMQGPETASAMIDVGDATFTWLTPGDYNLSSDGSLNDTSGRLICSAFDHAGSPFLDVSVANNGPVGLELNPGRSIVCDWFVMPTPAFYNAKYDVSVSAVKCDSASVRIPGPASGLGLPAGCSFLSGITVSVYPYLTGPGPFGDSCTTNQAGGCNVSIRGQVPLNGWVEPANWPAGYGLPDNPFYIQPQYTEFAHITVLFVPLS